MNDIPRPAEFALNSSVLFEWLSALFAAPPSARAIAAYRRGPVAALLAALATDEVLAAGASAMSQALASPGSDTTLAAKLSRAFALLFEGLGGPNTASPYESFHRCGGRLFQAPAAEMEALLAARDLSVARDAAEPADHLSIELALTSQLYLVDDLATGQMIARLANWIPAFSAACAAADISNFWTGAAQLLSAVVEREKRQLQLTETVIKGDPK